ncbi:MAG: N-acetyltransferase [Bacteroidota bacterium]
MIIIGNAEVDEGLKGQGVGKQPLLKVVEYAREKGIKIMPLHLFAKSVFAKDASLKDVL